jgi:hypothetical protein
VGAIFDAFRAIYSRRVADLFRIASSGTGLLSPGALHPDLVNRLADEAAKTAKHMLTMCIRALDYCPPVDICFGDFLRAVITADCDLVPDDFLGYRVALIEAFRHRGIYPRDVRTLSVDSLRWPLVRELEGGADDVVEQIANKLKTRLKRERYASRTRAAYWRKTDELADVMRDFVGFDGRTDLSQVVRGALELTKPLPGMAVDEGDDLPRFEVHSVRPAQRVGPDGDVLNHAIVVITQERQISLDASDPDAGTFTFRGGCTLIIDLDTSALRYVIGKAINCPDRLERQRQYRRDMSLGSLRSTYLAGIASADDEEPFALLHSD